ncbi:MAG: lysozyme [Rubrivivax sp.]|nr:lysozyme [Rubrivivax sp.]
MPAALRDVPQEAVELIKAFEGIPDGDPSTVNIDAYLDPVGIWTIGWGHAIRHGRDFLRGAHNRAVARALFPGGITRAQAEALLRADLIDFAAGVLNRVRVALDDGQFGALVSFAFNVGLGNLGQSTLLRRLNAGDVLGAADQFLVWNKGRVRGVLTELPGLTRRRRAERALFLGEDWRAAGAVRTTRGRSRAAAPLAEDARIRPEAPPGSVSPPAPGTAAKQPTAATAAAKQAAAEKAAAEKADARKAAARKAAAAEAAAGNAPAKKAAARKAARRQAAMRRTGALAVAPPAAEPA